LPCEYMHKDCKADCDNHQCRAFFPLRQPLIDPKSKDICLADDHATECLIYAAGREWREEKRLNGLTEKCPFAQNNICGKSWWWWCKGGTTAFQLTPFEEAEDKPGIPKRNSDGTIAFIVMKNESGEPFDIYTTCLSGDPAIYMTCPHYKLGVETRELSNSLKSQKNNE